MERETQKLVTAEEFALENMQGTDLQEIESALVEFAQYHVKLALEAAGEKAALALSEAQEIQKEDSRKYVSKKAIINSYPLENIK